ncbi:MAG: leucyl aminopeptidase family protein [Caulobacterales bacterium]
MNDLPFLRDAPSAIPIHAMRPAEWSVWSETRSEAVRRLAMIHDFKAQSGRMVLVPATDGSIERVLFGLGEHGTAMQIGTLATHLPDGDYRIAQAPRDLQAGLVAIAWGLGTYAFDRYKKRKRPIPRLVMPDGADAADVERVVRASFLARDLVNTPAGDLGPDALHGAAEAIAAKHGAIFEAIVGDELLSQNYPLIHAVGRAAKGAPRIVRISWGKDDAPRVTLVGKGVTFDSGGLDIKPDSAMRIMKKDMGGAAHALALADIVMDAQLPVRLDVYLPIVENAISGDAFRPGDVIRSRKGLTVEVDNTDAEGRLILADALSRASEDKPELMIDFATLTGAARVALGPDMPPLYTDDETLAADLVKASVETADPLWRLPLWQPYEGDMDSPVADLKNGGDAGMAGSIYAALFLKKFVDAKAWAHFDIYAWAPREKPARPAGGEAQTLRACWRVLRQRYGK